MNVIEAQFEHAPADWKSDCGDCGGDVGAGRERGDVRV